MHDLIVFIDSGDTLINEETQMYEGWEIVSAEFIPGGREFLLRLHQEKFLVALVADGNNQDFLNVYREQMLRQCFDAWVVSEVVGKQKPNAIMFETAMDALQLRDEDKKRIVMIGNNIRKDVKGANLFGITSIWFDWSPRYSHVPQDASEKSCYTVRDYDRLYALLLALDEKAKRGELLC